MEKYEFSLTPSAQVNIDETLEILLSAAQEIASAQEQDFERIKEKKWYKRIWEIITFNEDNKKLQARSIGSLAKLNEITLKALVLISKKNQETANWVLEGLNKIKENANHISDIYDMLQKTIEKVLDISRAFKFEKRFDELSEEQRDVICAIVNKYAGDLFHKKCLFDFSEKRNKHTQKLLEVLNSSVRQTYDNVEYSIVESSLNDEDSHKTLFNILQGYNILLGKKTVDEKHEVFSYIKLSDNTKNKIREKVKTDIETSGEEGYINQYALQNIDENDSIADDTDINFQLQENIKEEYRQEQEVEREIEVLNINNMVHIAPEEIKSYEYKEIHIESLIHCKGILEFNNCVITYNEKSSADEITLEEGAEIRAVNCTFIGKGIDENHFITMAANCTVGFDKCLFKNCHYFLKGNSYGCYVRITGSELYNCMDFAKLHGGGSFELSSTKICVDNKIEYNSKYTFLFNVAYDNSIIDNVTVSNLNDSMEWNCFSIKGTISNSAFFGINGTAIESDHINKCYFENCKGNYFLVEASRSCLSKKFTVDSCTFNKCENIVRASANSDSIITQCSFQNCVNTCIFASSAYGTGHPLGLKISFCEFINYTNDYKEGSSFIEKLSIFGPLPAAIQLDRIGDGISTINNCVFNGVNIDGGFLISFTSDDKMHGKERIKISDCDFKKCRTNRQSGTLFKKYSHYTSGVFSKKDNYELAVKIDNCRGIDSSGKIVSEN